VRLDAGLKEASKGGPMATATPLRNIKALVFDA
jgi:hypothetical protein